MDTQECRSHPLSHNISVNRSHHPQVEGSKNTVRCTVRKSHIKNIETLNASHDHGRGGGTGKTEESRERGKSPKFL